jgi:putative metallohydrolase (TIGR04338 family)
VAECQRFVDSVVSSEFWRSRWPDVTHVEVRDGRGRRKGGAAPLIGAITLPRAVRRRYYILHELAHIAVNRDETLADHGPEYASAYLDLVLEFEGENKAEELLQAYLANKVKSGRSTTLAPRTPDRSAPVPLMRGD